MRIEMNNGTIRDDVVMYRNINIHSKQFITFYTYLAEHCGLSNRIRLITNLWFYFSKWIFGVGFNSKYPSKCGLLSKKSKLFPLHGRGSIYEWGYNLPSDQYYFKFIVVKIIYLFILKFLIGFIKIFKSMIVSR